MKKIIALALSLMLLIGCVSALAEAADKHTITMLGAFTVTTDKLPEGYKMNVIKNSEMEYEALITSPEAGKPYYVLVMNFSDEWDGVKTLDDATEDDIREVKEMLLRSNGTGRWRYHLRRRKDRRRHPPADCPDR